MRTLAFLLGALLCWPAWAQQVPHPVGGPATSTLNEIASWNNASGDLLKHGVPAGLTGDQITGSTADGFQVQFKNQTSSDANALDIWKCTIGSCVSAAVGNFDQNRIITVVPPGSTTELQTSQGIYFVNKTGRPGPPYSSFPVYVGQNIIGICDADGAGCWAGNSIITDNKGQVPLTKPLRFMAGWEADFNVNSVNSQVSGFMTGGSSTVQPSAANGYSCLWLDGQAARGTIAKWSTCFSSQHGSASNFADIGTAEEIGAMRWSQRINMYFRDATDVLRNISYAATPGGILFATNGSPASGSLVVGAGSAFVAGDNGGMQINTHTAVVGQGTIVSFASDVNWTETRLGNTTGITAVFGTPNLPDVGIGTPNASLCMNAANQIIKKTTAGPCI